MYRLSLHPDAKSDLDELWDTDEISAARIETILQEIQHDQNMLDMLTVHNFGIHHTQPLHVSKWLEFWNVGINLWRVKLWDLEDKGLRYRIVYAFMLGKQQYYVLGILPRDWNYDENHQLTKRIKRAYDSLL